MGYAPLIITIPKSRSAHEAHEILKAHKDHEARRNKELREKEDLWEKEIKLPTKGKGKRDNRYMICINRGATLWKGGIDH